MFVTCEKTIGEALQPGDLFSMAGPDYWNTIHSHDSIGEKVWLRTNTPADDVEDKKLELYRIHINYSESDES